MPALRQTSATAMPSGPGYVNVDSHVHYYVP